jgi:hypothetical protein
MLDTVNRLVAIQGLCNDDVCLTVARSVAHCQSVQLVAHHTAELVRRERDIPCCWLFPSDSIELSGLFELSVVTNGDAVEERREKRRKRI